MGNEVRFELIGLEMSFKWPTLWVLNLEGRQGLVSFKDSSLCMLILTKVVDENTCKG